MRLIKRIIFLSTFLSIFVLVYRHSDQKGFRRFIKSFKITSLLIGIGSGLIPISAEAFENNVQTMTNPTLTERLLPRSSFNHEINEFKETSELEFL